MVIDETMIEATKEEQANAKPSVQIKLLDPAEDDETKRLRVLLSDTHKRLNERLAKPRCPVETVLPTTQQERVEKEPLAPASTPQAP